MANANEANHSSATTGKLGRWIFVGLALGLAACGGSTAPAGSRSAPPPQQAYPSSPGYGADAASGYQPRGESGPPAPPAAAATAEQSRGADRKSAEAPAAGDRPGLATHWGETRHSQIRTTTFYRADPDRPSVTGALWYNDREGSRAMAASEGYRSFDRATMSLAEAGITMSLRDESGRALPGYFAGGKTFAIGEAGSRYVIVLTNNTPARFETVVSVDGLDVLDGRPASFTKRGYLLNPHSSLEIEGFRQSESSVAAFRFGSVRGSYADRKGDDRNVGVIGVAIFHERGFGMWPWDDREVERRKGADPFPGRFATPP